MGKVLVAYFSASGVTKKAAEKLARVTGADPFEITPRIPYTAEDLDWSNPQSRSSREMQNPDARPAITGKVEDMSQYDAVFVGFPIWWGIEPSVVDTFLEAYDLSGKKIVPFCTSGGSGIGDTAKRIQQIAGAASVRAGKRLTSAISEEELAAWAAELGL